MKRVILSILIALGVLINTNVFSQDTKKENKSKNPKKGQPEKVELKTYTDTISYLIGSDIGKNLQKNLIEINHEIFIKGLKDGKTDADTLMFTEEQKQAIMGKLQQELQKQQQAKMVLEAEVNKAEGKKFLDENKSKNGVITLPSGLQYKVIKLGTGPTPAATDKVTVNYEGKLLNGKIFDSSYERKEPATFPLNGVIKGWTEGLQLMPTGSTYEFYIPSDLAYGDRGNQGIPPGSVLVFKVELISIEGK